MILKFDDDDGWIAESKSLRIKLHILVKMLREEKGVSIGAASTLAGINHPLLHNFENGEVQSPHTGLRVLEALGYSTFIFGGNLEDEDVSDP